MPVLEAVLPLFLHGLETYDHILTQAAAYASDKGLSVDDFFSARLIEDQLPLSFQVQNTTSLAQINVGRLLGEPITPFDKDEKTFAELQARVKKTIAFLKTVDRSKADEGKEDSNVDVPALGKTYEIPAKVAVLSHGLPNFFFHLNTGYSILRSKGVPLGKKDYLLSFLSFASQ